MPAVGLYTGMKKRKKKDFNKENWDGNEEIIFKQWS